MLVKGTQVEFTLHIPYVGTKRGAGIVVCEGEFAILGESYTVKSDGSGDYKVGEHVQVKRSSITKLG